MNLLWPVFAREFKSYFATPLAFVFIVIFLFAMGAFTFYLGHFYENGSADLTVFFGYHPWLYLFLVPALAMRLWAEERRSGSMELLCSAGHGFPLNGMVSMYLLMSAFHSAPWLKLVSRRRSGTRREGSWE